MSELKLTEDIKKDVSINVTDLDTEMIQHPSLYVHYALKTVQARKAHDIAKNTLDIKTAQLYAKHRTALLDGGNKATESTIDAAVKTDEVYVKALFNVTQTQAEWRLAEVTEQAFVQRKDMILELARDRRKEREGQLRVLEQQAQRNSVLEGLKEITNSK